VSDLHAAIDIGTNSIHLVVARVRPEGGFEVVSREKTAVRLGSGPGDLRSLEPDAIQRGVEAIAHYARLAESLGADVTAVATSAVREASNRDDFLRRVARESGVDVEVISGVEEARLIHLGVLQAVPVFDEQLLLIDIGGGSTELLVGLGPRVLAARSVKLGHIRLTDRFFADGRSRSKKVTECRRYLAAFLTPVARDIAEVGFERTVGSSGTIASIATMVEHHHGREPTRWVNNATFDREDLGVIVDEILAAKTTGRRGSLTGLDPRRADVIVAGALLLEALFDELSIPAMTVSEYALREGVLLDRIAAGDRGDVMRQLSDIRRDSVLGMADRFSEDRSEVEHATDLALEMFDQLADHHGYGSAERDLLEAAGMLHNVGLFISHAAHHKHSYYVIRHTDQLVGFTEGEIELIAQISRYHRRSAPKASHEPFMALDEADRALVRMLAGLLRVGIALDRSRSEVVADVECRLGDELEIVLTVAPGTDADVEIFTATERTDLLADAVGRPVRIVVA
jgi:exopolyphosphatase/guanosine-5'-triphosphate,3'-diphosphate pyrophosphatase